MNLAFDPMVARVQALAERALGRKRARLMQAFRELFQPDGQTSPAARLRRSSRETSQPSSMLLNGWLISREMVFFLLIAGILLVVPAA